jgi:hypothetical protein
MAVSIIAKIIHKTFSLFKFAIFLNFVKSLKILSPHDGSHFLFGTLIPVQVVNSDTSTVTTYSATFVSSAGTYQVAGLSIGITYTLIPAGLHGFTNLIINAAVGTTAIATIKISEPVAPIPRPTAIYPPTACYQSNIYPLPYYAENEYPDQCFRTPNTPPDRRKNRRKACPNSCVMNEKPQFKPKFSATKHQFDRQLTDKQYSNRCHREENKK